MCKKVRTLSRRRSYLITRGLRVKYSSPIYSIGTIGLQMCMHREVERNAGEKGHLESFRSRVRRRHKYDSCVCVSVCVRPMLKYPQLID